MAFSKPGFDQKDFGAAKLRNPYSNKDRRDDRNLKDLLKVFIVVYDIY